METALTHCNYLSLPSLFERQQKKFEERRGDKWEWRRRYLKDSLRRRRRGFVSVRRRRKNQCDVPDNHITQISANWGVSKNGRLNILQQTEHILPLVVFPTPVIKVQQRHHYMLSSRDAHGDDAETFPIVRLTSETESSACDLSEVKCGVFRRIHQHDLCSLPAHPLNHCYDEESGYLSAADTYAAYAPLFFQ